MPPSHGNSAVQGILCTSANRGAEATTLAGTLSLPLLTTPTERPYLLLDEVQLSLIPGAGIGAVSVDFVGGPMGHRRRFGGGRSQLLARAIGLTKGNNPSIIDATAGLGRDAFVLASLGCRVRLIERSAIIAALLRDGLGRASIDSEIGDWVSRRMRLHEGDARLLIPQLHARETADVIYLDPMYPHRKKSALVKKEMRIFRQLVGGDPDAAELLQLAIGCGCRRVVVKRPRLGDQLTGPAPNLSMTGKSTRYDIYLHNW